MTQDKQQPNDQAKSAQAPQEEGYKVELAAPDSVKGGRAPNAQRYIVTRAGEVVLRTKDKAEAYREAGLPVPSDPEKPASKGAKK